MTEQSHLDALKALREILVGERRRAVAAALEAYAANGELGHLGGAPVEQIQAQIEAIDEAIEEERRLQPPAPYVPERPKRGLDKGEDELEASGDWKTV